MRHYISNTIIPLSEIQKGEKGILELIQAHMGLSSRLMAMGLTPGVTVEMIQNYGRGPLIVNVRGTHVALGRGMARHLFVKKEDINEQ